MRLVIVFLVLMGLLVIPVHASSYYVKTKYRTELNFATRKSRIFEEVSTFTFYSGKFLHESETPKLTSVYVYDGGVSFDIPVVGTTLRVIPVVSEAGTHYLYVFDFDNKRIYCFTSTGGYLVQFDMEGPIMLVDDGGKETVFRNYK